MSQQVKVIVAYLTATVLLFGAIAVGGAYEASKKADCRVAYAQSNRPAAEIAAICK